MRRVLYHADQTLPHHTSGYATRTHGLASALRALGWELEVHGRLGYPNDRLDFLGARLAGAATDVDGVPYRFAPYRWPLQVLRRRRRYVAASAASLIDRARGLRPSIVHAASNHLVGQPAIDAARRLGVPSIYEVRGLWHLTRAAGDPAYLGSDHFHLIEALEARAAAAADHVFVITSAIGDALAARGVPRARMTVVPNAVDTDRFTPRAHPPGAVPTIGYVGSFKPFEGLDDLLEAAARLRAARGDAFRLLLVGDGPARRSLERRARALGLGAITRFTGRRPHAEIERWYAAIDVMAFPRKGLPVCEVVSPIKPFEAMAMARPVVVSSVAALTEIVAHERTGLVHRKDDPADLAAQLGRLLDRPAWARELGAAGAAWVRAHRSWARIAADVDAVYRALTP